MLILEFITLFIMFIGQVCTLGPNLYGTLIILVAVSLYSLIMGFGAFQLWVLADLLVLSIIAEVVLRWLRIFLTKNYKVSRSYSINTTVCNLAGVIVADAILGTYIGVTMWEIVVGKAFFPYLDSISKILMRLIFIAMLRFICGLLMITIISNNMILGK